MGLTYMDDMKATGDCHERKALTIHLIGYQLCMQLHRIVFVGLFTILHAAFTVVKPIKQCREARPVKGSEVASYPCTNLFMHLGFH